VACRLVDVRVDRHHELERRECGVEPVEFGLDETGLPPTVTSARTWPSPGVSISSGSAVTGNSPNASGPIGDPTWLDPAEPRAAARARAAPFVDGCPPRRW
jgi:hypothetical protein